MLLNALDQHRNLHKAAAAIHTTQPAATALLKQLEEGLGVPLFERRARGMEPTAFGEVMIRYARGVLHDFEHAGEEIDAISKGQMGVVRIGSVMGAMPVILTDALARFKKEHPKVRMTLHVDTSDMLIPALLRGDLDVVLGRLPDRFEGEELAIEAMEGEPMVVIARPGHPHFDKPKLKIKDLVTSTWVLHPTGSPMRQRIEQALQQASLTPPRDIVETSSILATTALLESTDMISVTSLDVAQHYAHYGMLGILPVKLPMTMAKLGILTRKGREVSFAVKSFMGTLRESALGHNSSKKTFNKREQR